MTVFRLLPNAYIFPPTSRADSDGLLAFGGGLEPERLLAAYQRGIFPWYNAGSPILWWFTSPRMVVFPNEFHIPKRAARYRRKSPITISFDTDFNALINLCADHRKREGEETWILPEVITAYNRLHHLGYAHSVECRLEDELVGGLYGVELGSVFFGESMVSTVSHASQFALMALVEILTERGCTMIDCQMTTDYLQRFGGREIDREEFSRRLTEGIISLEPPPPWR